MSTLTLAATIKSSKNNFQMTSDRFRALLRRQLESASDRVLLRVLVSRKESELVEFTGPELCARSIELAQKYCQAPPSGVVLLLLPHSAELFLLHLGLLLMGRLPAILAWPTNRVDPEKYQRNILHQLRSLPAAQLITLPRLARNLDPGMPFTVSECPIHEYERFESLFSMRLSVVRVEKQDSCHVESPLPEGALFLQFSGGTTDNQKCVVVTAPMLVNQLDRLSKALQFHREDSVASWLPLYHDMGLIACFWLPLWNETASIQFAASEWLLDPGMLFHFMSKHRATFCWLPNFAFSYLAAQKERVDTTVNLAHVRAWINCSEPVRDHSFRAFVEAFSGLGVHSEQCQASYALAENVFAATQTQLGRAPATFSRAWVKGTSLDVKPSYKLQDDRYVSSGRSLENMAFRIRRSNGDLCGDAEAGAIEIRGESLFCGYWGKDGFQSQSLNADGWYVTGDYGFACEDNLYVIGRIKDIIKINGVNVFPEDVEALVGTVKGLYPGRVVAFGVDDKARGTESLVVVAEIRGEFNSSSAEALELEIRRLVSSVLGIAPRFVRVTPERWIVKSTAGKISRSETRLRFLREFSGPSVPNCPRHPLTAGKGRLPGSGAESDAREHTV
ncbi:MAG: AMP-binding protein [Candidatus Acidiferrum sp.]